MARQSQASEFNTFVGGLITEASPLTFPANAAIDINNFSLNKDGTTQRRLGMDFEDSHTLVETGVAVGISGEIAISTFNWGNAGGDPEIKLVVIQTGNVLKFFDANKASVSGSLIHTHTYTTSEVGINYNATVVDGILVVTSGLGDISKFTYLDGVITEDSFRIKIRDLFGVEDVIGGLDLRELSNIGKRVSRDDQTQNHTYNLRNSTYALPRLDGEDKFQSSGETGPGAVFDPIRIFTMSSGEGEEAEEFPSNSDSVTSALFPDETSQVDRFTERFFPDVARDSARGNFESPKGYFIIDLLDRGTSRLSEINKLEVDHTYIQNLVTELKLDKTPDGATLVAEFAGRAWYGGFSGNVVSGDKHSPKLSSYLTFSKLVESTADLGVCHQTGDPTSKESPDLLDTDGGFIRLDGAFGLKKLVNIGSSLIVVAENGVWAVVGGNDFNFTALESKVVKITNHGCTNGNSVVQVDNSIMYWGDDGIYQIASNEIGTLTALNLTNTTIQTLYDNISDLDKLSVQGNFDTFERRVRWLHGNRIGDDNDTIEIVLDINLSAFYINTIPGTALGKPNLVAPVEVPSFKVGEVISLVINGPDSVVHLTNPVQFTSSVRQDGLREILYVTVTKSSPTIEYTLSKFRDGTFVDWKTFDGTGIDAPAFILTGYNGGGDFQRYKQVPYVTFHFERTEDGFTADINGDLFPDNESSCKVQAQWEWANSPTSGRFGKEFQAYRYKRVFIPQDASDTFDTGFKVISTKNKLRGKGKVLSLLLKSEPLKDLKILGWSIISSSATNV